MKNNNRRFPAAGPTPVGQRLRASTIHGRRSFGPSVEEFLDAVGPGLGWDDNPDKEHTMSTFTFTITAAFTADNRDEAFDDFIDWLSDPSNITPDAVIVTEEQS